MTARNAGTDDKIMQALRSAGRRHPDVEEGVACKGTAVESVTFKVHGKAFLFLRAGKAMLKLGKSQDAASKLAAKKPACYKVGAGGWATVDLSTPQELSMKVIVSWIDESYSLFAEPKAPATAKRK